MRSNLRYKRNLFYPATSAKEMHAIEAYIRVYYNLVTSYCVHCILDNFHTGSENIDS